MYEKIGVFGNEENKREQKLWYVISDEGMLKAMLLAILLILLGSVLLGVVLYFAWNISMPVMFGAQKIKVYEAIILVGTLVALKSTCLYDFYKLSVITIKQDANYTHEETGRDTCWLIKVMLWILGFIFTQMLIIISWNEILIEVLNISGGYIEIFESLGITAIIYLITGDPGFKEKYEMYEKIEKDSCEADKIVFKN